MNYTGKKIAITGTSGFIGGALKRAFEKMCIEVVEVDLDVRDPAAFSFLDHTYDCLFHFAAPSSQVLFKRKPAYCIETTLKGLMNAADACEKHGIRLIYPSTGLLSSDRYNEYALCKKISENYVQGRFIDALGIRIFASYGPGEDHKADYASVPFLFARDMLAGRAPVVFGDGEQVRDFVFIDDVVESILHLAEECYYKIVDVGSGEQTSFNQILTELKFLIPNAPDAVYVDSPVGYVKETAADPTRLHDFYTPKVTFAEGVAKMVNSLKKGA